MTLRLALILLCVAAMTVAAAALVWRESVLPVTLTAAAIGVTAVVLARYFTTALSLVASALRRYGEPAEIAELEQIAKLDPRQLGSVVGDLLERQRGRLADASQRGEQLSVILEGMAEGVVAVDQEETVLRINSAALRMLDIPANPRGRKLWEVTRSAPVIAVLRGALAHGEDAAGELVVRDGVHEHFLDLVASPLRDGRQAVTGAVLVLHDVTQVRRLEQVRRDFVANVGHELKTPLTAIHALVETVREDAGMDGATRRDFLGRTLAQSQRLQDLIADLLLLSRVESQEEVVQFDVVDLGRVLRDSLSSLQPAAEAKAIALEVTRELEPVRVRGNAELLRQAIGNLIDNAIKYTPPGGQVAIRIGTADTRTVVSVADNGVGIPPENLDRIFERFYRVDKARSRQVGGTGLGLAIVKHIALLHQGSVRVESQFGKGSVFTIDLPWLES